MLLVNGEFYIQHRFIRGMLSVEKGRIAAFVPETAAGRYVTEAGEGALKRRQEACRAVPSEEVVDLAGRRIAPGFVDVHTHGACGVDVNAASPEELEKLCRFFAAQGTTSFLVSILTDTEEGTLSAIRAAREWESLAHSGARIDGIHLEGPFLSPSYKGAMPESLLRDPDIDLVRRYQEEAEGRIKYITISPELPGAIDMIPALSALGIRAAIGHSGADYDTACAAIAAGACAATHTGNAMKLADQHYPAIFGAVLEDPDVYCEMICDGRHLHPGMVRLIIKAKGREHVIAITDSMMAAGLPDGRYKLGINDVIVADGDATLASNGARAGSTLTSGHAFHNLLAFTGLGAEGVLPFLTENPARMLGREREIGSLVPGSRADFIVLDGEDIAETWVDGRCVFRR